MATIQKRGNKWRVQIRRRGFPHQARTFGKKTDAQAWARKIESQMDQEEYVPETNITLSELIDRRIKEAYPDPCAHRTYRQQLEWWRQELGASYARLVTPEAIAVAVERLKQRTNRYGAPLGPASINRYLACLSAVYRDAVKHWHLLKRNPVREVARKREPKGRQEYLNQEQIRALLSACRAHKNPYLYTATALALCTGMRRGEIEGLTWDRVSLREHKITLTTSKTGEPRIVPLYGVGHEALTEYAKTSRRIDSPLVFPGRAGDPTKRTDIGHDFHEVVKTAGLENFRFHDCRHTAASLLANSGAELLDIMKILGHKQLETTKRYAHLTEKRSHQVARKMAEEFLP